MGFVVEPLNVARKLTTLGFEFGNRCVDKSSGVFEPSLRKDITYLPTIYIGILTS